MQPLENAHALIIGIADYHGIRKLPRVADARDLAAVLADPALLWLPQRQRALDRRRPGHKPGHPRGARAAGQQAQGLMPPCSSISPGTAGGSTMDRTRGSSSCRSTRSIPRPTTWPAPRSRAPSSPPPSLRSRARRLTVVLDCCHAGGIGEPRDLVPTEKVEAGLSDNYLDALKAGTGRAIIAATRATTPAYVREAAKYGVFTGHFLDGLRGGAPAPEA